MANAHSTFQSLEQLTDCDLLAALLATVDKNSETAARLLAHAGSLRALVNTPLTDLATITGLNADQVLPLTAALEIHHRLNTTTAATRPTINSAEDAAHLVTEMRFLLQEQVRLILLDVNSRVLGIPTVYIGTLHGTVIRTAEIFREPLLRNCPALILAHNHPAGDPVPSPEDLELTRALIAAGKLLDIHLLDHLILAESGWCSLKQQGLAF